MKINELQAGQGKVYLTVEVVDCSQPREFEKFGKSGRVANATVRDDTGSISLTLWNEQVDQVSQGDTIDIENGYVSEYKGEKQLSTGKYGQLKKSEKQVPPSAAPAAQEQSSPAQSDDSFREYQEERIQ